MRKITLIIFLLLCVWARAGNVVSLPSASGAPGEEVTLTVALANDDPVTAMQLQVPVGDGITVVTGSEVLTSRAAGHSAKVGVRDSVLNIMVWSNGMATIAPGSGDVLSFRVLLGNEPQTIALDASKVTITDASGATLSGSATAGSVTITAAKAQLATRDIDFGHIPIRDVYHQSLGVTNVGNVPLIVTGIDPSVPELSSSTSFPYEIAPGTTGYVDITYSPVERGAIEETVRLLSNNIAGTNTIRVVADPFAVNELHVENTSGIADSTVTIPLRVNNMDAITGFQFEFDLPEQLQYVDGSFALSDRKGDHQLVVTHNNGKLRAIAYSLGNSTFSGNDGVIASFDVKLNGRYGCNLGASKAVLTAIYKGQDMDVLSNKYEGYIDIQSPQLYADEQLDLGATPVTEDAQGEVSVYNNGGAPLRIDRVVFSGEDFTVAESFPMVIDPWQSVTLHVTYNGQEQAPFEAMMQLYSNDPDHRLHNITITGSRFAPNYLHFTADDVLNDGALLLHVDLSNYDPVDGIQFDVTYPSQWFTPTDEYTWGERASGFSMAHRSMGNGVIRCFIYSLANSEIAPGEGRVVTMHFTTADGTPEGEYSLSFANMKAGTPGLIDKYAGGNEQCTFSVSTRIIGDVNCDGYVSSADITALYGYLLSGDLTYFATSDVNNDGYVSSADITEVYNILLGISH
ncbi:MAG: choice-of-anchor D domain-containing protein [Muribaculaceae bacterium]|nr:choice-of-anchor D domain-containing protein [Muribaculaceae bacterium]MBR0025410.1 choice-of-anchor D domain-containing protein [Muribaculaceae bacterium]